MGNHSPLTSNAQYLTSTYWSLPSGLKGILLLAFPATPFVTALAQGTTGFAPDHFRTLTCPANVGRGDVLGPGLPISDGFGHLRVAFLH
ncbi:hypothetical protein FQZ97_1019700 [compost metagenome]